MAVENKRKGLDREPGRAFMARDLAVWRRDTALDSRAAIHALYKTAFRRGLSRGFRGALQIARQVL